MSNMSITVLIDFTRASRTGDDRSTAKETGRFKQMIKQIWNMTHLIGKKQTLPPAQTNPLNRTTL